MASPVMAYARERESDVEIFEMLGPFWTIGIVVNVTLTALAGWWVIRMMRPRKPPQGVASDGPEAGGRS